MPACPSKVKHGVRQEIHNAYLPNGDYENDSQSLRISLSINKFIYLAGKINVRAGQY